MRKKNFCSFCVAAALLLGSGAANAETGSWTSGSTTVVLTDDSVLTVSGTGAMEDDFYDFPVAPWHAFSDAIKTLVINEGVTSIGGGAFPGCRGLTSVTIPDGVTSIGYMAFSDCSGLTSITIPNSVTSIGKQAFSSCSGLTSITMPNSVTSVGDEAFFWCSGLTSVTIPNGVTSIGYEAFYNCRGLTSVTIPNSVTSIGSLAFSGCRGLTAINVDAANTQYGSVDGVLYNRNQDTLVMYPDGKSGALTIPNSVTSIGNYAFYNCRGLTSVTIPNSVTSIGNYAFWNCRGLTSVTIPDSVTSIGNDAFSSCYGFTSVTIPNSVTSIGHLAFSFCSGLTSVFCLAAKPPILKKDNFTSVDVDTLYVPESALDTYKNNSDWSRAFDIILAIESTTGVKTVDADKLHAYPNPTTGVVYVENANGAEVKVYNLNGALLHRTRESRVDLSGEPSGVYLLRVGGETLKVVKK